jgi:erythromycin esterase
MTVHRDSLPDITRPDTDIALVSEWTVNTPQRQRAVVETAIDTWEHDWPEGLLSHNCFVGTEDITVLHFSQWSSEETAAEWVRTDHQAWLREIDAVADSEHHEIVPYRLYRSFVPGGPPHTRGCIVVITFDTDGPEWQRKLVDWLVDRLPDSEPHPGMISNHFHLSTDGTQVLNYTEWTDADAHRDVIETDLREDSEVPQMIDSMAGVTPLGYKRFQLHRSLGKPLLSNTGASTLKESIVSGEPLTGKRAVPDTETVTRWINEQALPLTTLDPQASLTDLEPLHEMVRDATVVGLGGATRGAHELSAIKHRVLRFLIEELGFRSLALEADWTKGVQLDEYVRTGNGDPEALLADARPFWRTEEFLDVVRWMRSYNQQHSADPLRIVGMDITGVRALAYDAVAEYVRRAAPDRLAEIETHYEVLRPSNGIDEHTEWYRSQPDKQPFIDHARLAHDLVDSVPAHDSHALALQHASAVVGFYEYHALDSLGYVEPRLAENAIWWHEYTGDTIVYWGGMAHTANGTPRTVSSPPSPPATHRNAGSYLRDHFGESYASIGLTFDHGSVPYPVPAPSPAFADAVLGSVGLDTYLLDLHAKQSDSVQAWLNSPTKTRLIGPHYDSADDAAYHMSGGSLAEWFDVIIHSQEATPIRLLV